MVKLYRMFANEVDGMDVLLMQLERNNKQRKGITKIRKVLCWWKAVMND